MPVSLQVGYASFAAGAPFDRRDEDVGVFECGPCRRGFAGAGDHDGGDAGGGEVGFDGRVPVAAVGGDHRRGDAEVGGDPFDGGASSSVSEGFPMCTE